jgi:hypothetical protein
MMALLRGWLLAGAATGTGAVPQAPVVTVPAS